MWRWRLLEQRWSLRSQRPREERRLSRPALRSAAALRSALQALCPSGHSGAPSKQPLPLLVEDTLLQSLTFFISAFWQVCSIVQQVISYLLNYSKFGYRGFTKRYYRFRYFSLGTGPLHLRVLSSKWLDGLMAWSVWSWTLSPLGSGIWWWERRWSELLLKILMIRKIINYNLQKFVDIAIFLFGLFNCLHKKDSWGEVETDD